MKNIASLALLAGLTSARKKYVNTSIDVTAYLDTSSNGEKDAGISSALTKEFDYVDISGCTYENSHFSVDYKLDQSGFNVNSYENAVCR